MGKKGVSPITTAALSEPKIAVPGITKQKKQKSAQPNNKALAALFGKKATKPTIQSTPTKVAAL